MMAGLWRYRHAWFWPMVLVPLLVVAWAMGQPTVYTGSITLQLDQSHASSPLLKNWSNPDNEDVLRRVLNHPELLADTSRDSAAALVPANLRLDVLNSQLVRISYRTTTPKDLDTLMATLAYNFIYELLAPERLRLEQQLASVGGDLRQTEARMLVPQLAPGEREQLASQRTMLQQRYRTTLEDLSVVNAAFDQGSPHALMWPTDAPVITAPYPPLWRFIGALIAGIGMGLAVAGFSVLAHQQQRASKALPENLAKATGETVLGNIPDLGTVTIVPRKGKGKAADEWHASVSNGGMALDPTSFTEVVRLHRALTRNLQGALMLTSASEAEGKTLLAALLALRSRDQGKPTLLIDLNLKDAALTDMFEAKPAAWGMQASGKRGRGKTDGAWAEALVPLGEGLHLLPVPNDADTLAFLQQGPRLLAWLEQLGSLYEHIIIDTTPLLATNRQNADPATMAASARAVLVVHAGVTPLPKVRHALELLRQQGAQVAGVVPNNVDNPDDKTLVLTFCRAVERVVPGLGQWLRARALRALAA